MAAREEWYAVKARPGTQRRAAPRIGGAPYREGEFIIERNLRDAGFEVYMPSYRRDLRHHRTNEYQERRFAMLVGYSFVNLPSRDFFALSRVDGVTAILGVRGAPTVISGLHVDALRLAELEAMSTLERERYARKERTRKQIEEEFPRGKRIQIAPSHRIVGGMLASVLDVTGRKTIKAVVETLSGLVHVDLSLDQIDKVA